MKFSTAVVAGIASVATAAPHRHEKRSFLKGLDISAYQDSDYNWSGAKSDGAVFAFIKATEGTSYKSPAFSSQYEGATSAGIIRGGYHFAHPDESSGTSQAEFFYENGGGWSGDGRTLPGMLDIEYNPDGSECYGLSQSEMVSWVKEFVDQYHSHTSRYPVIYSTNDWWSTCTGDSSAFSTTCPLNLADYNSNIGTIPGKWGFETFWQYNDDWPQGGDSDYFNGNSADLKKLATG